MNGNSRGRTPVCPECAGALPVLRVRFQRRWFVTVDLTNRNLSRRRETKSASPGNRNRVEGRRAAVHSWSALDIAIERQNKCSGERINAMYIDRLDGKIGGDFYDQIAGQWRCFASRNSDAKVVRIAPALERGQG